MAHNQESRVAGSFADTPQAVRPAPSPINRRRRRRQRLRRGLTACLLLGIVGHSVANLVASWMLHQELNSVIRRGEPLRFNQLAPALPPEAQNAATVYLQAAAALVLTSTEEAELRTFDGSPPDTALLAKNQAALRLLRQAATIPGCRFPVDYDAANLAGILLSHLTKMRTLAKVLALQAVWESQTDHTDAALADVAILFRMSEHLAPEPILISGISTMGIEKIGYKTLSRVLNHVSLSAERAREFTLLLSRADLTTMLHADLRGERCFGLWAFQYVSNPIQASQLLTDTAPQTSHPIMKLLSVLWAPLWKLDEIQYLRAIDRRSAMLQKPGIPLDSDDRFIEALPQYAICTRILLPALPATGNTRDQLLDYRRMAQVALALHAYRTEQGHYPPNLQTAEAFWGTAFPHDLYTDQPFVYKTEGETMHLYSVGPNRIDEGGDPQNHTDLKTGTQPDDLVW